MTDTKKIQTTTLTDLPPELLEEITTYLPTASTINSLGRTSKRLNAWVEKDAWKTFARNSFPSLCPQTTPSYKDAARTLTTLSKSWDKRAFIARYVEPQRNISAYPGRRKIDRWKRPRGQTIGFTPQLDVYEETGPRWQDRYETLAFSAGAEICIRETERGADEGSHWTTYRPYSAVEGRDDITTLHLLRPEEGKTDANLNFITGSANGDLQLISLPDAVSPVQDVKITYFATQGLKVGSSSIGRSPNLPSLLAANLNDNKVALYTIDSNRTKIVPSSQIDVHPPIRADGNPATNHKAWTTAFLSHDTLAVGVGLAEDPLRIYPVAEGGLAQRPARRFGLQNHLHALDGDISLQVPQAPVTSIYTIVPLPSSIASHDDGQVFLTGAYDGIVRLHDLRSPREVEQAYIDPADDSAIYSILPRGREKLMVGTSRHNLLKVFDMKMGAKCYSYQDIHVNQSPYPGHEVCDPDSDYNLFLRSNDMSVTNRGSNWTQSRNRAAESSVYSLASSSPHSPHVYAGVENTIYNLEFTEALDPFPDPTFFKPWSEMSKGPDVSNVLTLAMYDQGAEMRLCVQRSIWETWRTGVARRNNRGAQRRMDERWKGAGEFGA